MRIFFNALLLCLIMLFAVSCNNADAEQIDGEKVNMRHSSLLQITDYSCVENHGQFFLNH